MKRAFTLRLTIAAIVILATLTTFSVSAGIPSCGAGFHYDFDLHECVANAPVCPEGYNLVGDKCEAPIYQSEDNVQFNDSDLAVSLFKIENEDGTTALDFYDMTNNASQGEFLFSLTPDILAPFIGNPPAENTALFEGGHLGVYVLTTGEIQVNVGPDSEGKIHVKIFDALPWTHFYGYTIDPV